MAIRHYVTLTETDRMRLFAIALGRRGEGLRFGLCAKSRDLSRYGATQPRPTLEPKPVKEASKPPWRDFC